MGVCTHLGCVPLGQKISHTKGDYNGWYCPCHGSKFDLSGRVYSGVPAPSNLRVPPHRFENDSVLVVGENPGEADV